MTGSALECISSYIIIHSNFQKSLLNFVYMYMFENIASVLCDSNDGNRYQVPLINHFIHMQEQQRKGRGGDESALTNINIFEAYK